MTDRPRALAVLIAVFLLGCILGSAGSYWGLRKTTVPEKKGAQNTPPGPGPGMGRVRLPELLKMTPEQEARFEEIMEESHKLLDKLRVEQEPLFRQLDKLRVEQEPKIEAIVKDTNRKVMAILNETQQKKFSEFLKERESRRRRAPFGGRGMQGLPSPSSPPPRSH